jgi:thioredoxin 2
MSDATDTRHAVARCIFCGRLNRVNMARLADKPTCAECHKPLRLDRPIKVTDADFEKVIRGSTVPVLVDFYADWCGPCRMMAPTLDSFAAARSGQVLVLKLDTDANPSTAQRFGIRGIPTLIAFRGGAESGRHTGLADERVLEGLVGQTDGGRGTRDSGRVSR